MKKFKLKKKIQPNISNRMNKNAIQCIRVLMNGVRNDKDREELKKLFTNSEYVINYEICKIYPEKEKPLENDVPF